MEDLNNSINQLVLIAIYRTLYSTTEKYKSFSSAHGTFTKMSHKRSLCFLGGFPIAVQWKRIQLVSTSIWVPFLTSLSGLRIQCCCELWCNSQKQLRTRVAVVVYVGQQL